MVISISFYLVMKFEGREKPTTEVEQNSENSGSKEIQIENSEDRESIPLKNVDMEDDEEKLQIARE
jgi:hypothetical protein